MSDFFLELFSEEIPPKLQTNAREKLFLDIDNFFQENNIKQKGPAISFSIPNLSLIHISEPTRRS